ncbi:hypothetical protein ACGFRG_00170 [Streptomyces sp. NPDC048696]|uniref:hypothetical protein n=1 Tax=Streptomyces sp. NPDC048696 TaxID=3365585 RepID=UPI0037114A62
MRRVIAGAVGLVASLLMVSPAQAVDVGPNDYNLWGEDTCADPSASGFGFHIYFNSGQGGAYRNIGYSVYDFDSMKASDTSYHYLPFCELGASRPWPGSGQHVKNNAASGNNTHSSYSATVYFYSGFKGDQDSIGPYQHIDRFRNVYNENASFQWTS